MTTETSAEKEEDTSLKATLKTQHTTDVSVSSNEDNNGGHHEIRNGQGWGRGIILDAKRTILSHWKGEMININSKTIACSFFLYFACIAPAVTFGAIYGKATNNYIGAVEMIAATAWCGIAYAVLGGQPMMIVSIELSLNLCLRLP